MANARGLFATPFIAETIQDDRVLDAIREAIEAERARDPQGVAASNNGGWQSRRGILTWGGDAARRLGQHIATLAGHHSSGSEGEVLADLNWQADGWANINRKGDSNRAHVHAGAFWSAVVYIDDGYEGSDDPSLGGQLQLLDPRMPMIQMAAPQLRYATPEGEVQHAEIAFRPHRGLLVMFPAWLQHSVQTFHGEGERISVAINLVAAMSGSQD